MTRYCRAVAKGLGFAARMCLDRSAIAKEDDVPLDLWLAFVAASTALLLIPGPTVLLVLFTLQARRKGGE
jgi:hypothetical protein